MLEQGDVVVLEPEEDVEVVVCVLDVQVLVGVISIMDMVSTIHPPPNRFPNLRYSLSSPEHDCKMV